MGQFGKKPVQDIYLYRTLNQSGNLPEADIYILYLDMTHDQSGINPEITFTLTWLISWSGVKPDKTVTCTLTGP